jgi:NADH-quinone oxidoreductase subunit J
MLLNAGAERKAGQSYAARYLGVPLLVVLLGLLSFVIQRLLPPSEYVEFGSFTAGTPRSVGRLLFTRYLLPFEITSVLILVAILGAIVLARKEID